MPSIFSGLGCSPCLAPFGCLESCLSSEDLKSKDSSVTENATVAMNIASRDMFSTLTSGQSQQVIDGLAVMAGVLGGFLLIVLLKLYYLKYRRVETIHRISAFIASERSSTRACSSVSPVAGMDGLVDLHPMQPGGTDKKRSILSLPEGFVVGFLGSPSWETRIRREMDDHRWRERRASSAARSTIRSARWQSTRGSRSGTNTASSRTSRAHRATTGTARSRSSLSNLWSRMPSTLNSSLSSSSGITSESSPSEERIHKAA